MRIIAGLYRGKRILPPPGRTTRPITDRVKESLFSILGQYTCDAAVADLFAGTGSLGLEALSREARSCLFVENDRQALRILRQNIDAMGLGAKVRVSPRNAWYFAKFAHPDRPFDLIFVDPPYIDSHDSGQGSPLAELLIGLAQPRLLAENGMVVLRHESAHPCGNEYGRVVLTDSRRYGSMALSFLEPNQSRIEPGELGANE